jgi:hypothetical protein
MGRVTVKKPGDYQAVVRRRGRFKVNDATALFLDEPDADFVALGGG